MTTPSTLRFRAGIFDLDGVVTHTARLHAAAWKQMFDEYLERRAQEAGSTHVPFDIREDYRIYLDGKPRYEGVRSFLESRDIELPFGNPSDDPGRDTICGLGNRKNIFYHELLEQEGVEVFDSTVKLVQTLRSLGVRVGLMSSSKNTVPILQRSGLEDLFEARVDGVISEQLGLRGKPHPDTYLETASRLGVAADESFVVEDAVSGVEAGRRGHFGMVIGVDRGGHAQELRDAGADVVVGDLEEITVDDINAWFAARASATPSALEVWTDLSSQWGDKRIAVFLDYDGTLTPIVATPDLAQISPDMQATLRTLAGVCPTVIVSGRGREDVAGLVGLSNLYYAGSHGFDIAGPAGSDTRYEIGTEHRPALEQAMEYLSRAISGIDGALIEDKRFSIAVHYRLVADEHVARMERAVDQVIAAHPELKKAHGKKVFEVRPDIEWNKGRAVLWLLEALGLDSPDVVPLYIGDDVTDEDAFAALRERGWGVLVSERPRETKARLRLRDPNEVREFLGLISARQSSRDGSGGRP